MKKALTIILACCALTACGVKPSSVEPPEGAEDKTYPRTYPDMSTDPAPRGYN